MVYLGVLRSWLYCDKKMKQFFLSGNCLACVFNT
ncbi:unnamed protein product [Brassica rapa subsp. trilocularis]